MPPKKGSKKSHKDVNVDVTPVMNLFVVLIPFLLFSAVFVKLAVINVSLPGLLGGKDSLKPPKGPNISLSIGIDDIDKKIIIALTGDRNTTREYRFMKGGKKNANAFVKAHDYLVTIKRAYPHVMDFVLYPDAGVKYDMIVSVIDLARDLLPTDPEIFRKEKGQQIKVQALFPNVVVGSI
jgi:biopolymer transport protein ExbD